MWITRPGLTMETLESKLEFRVILVGRVLCEISYLTLAMTNFQSLLVEKITNYTGLFEVKLLGQNALLLGSTSTKLLETFDGKIFGKE